MELSLGDLQNVQDHADDLDLFLVNSQHLLEDLRDGRATSIGSEEPRTVYHQVIELLRKHHRVISEMIVSINHNLGRIALLSGSVNSPEAQNLLGKLSLLQKQRELIDAHLQKEIRALRTLEKRLGNIQGVSSRKKDLINVRHPNRDFFLADLFDYAMKDDGASMEAPIFTLSTKPDLSIWEWRSKDGNKYIKVAPSVLGRATQHDKDILIYVISQLVEGLNKGRDDARNRTVRFTVYDFLVTTNRQVSGDGYQRLHESFERLAGTRISTDIKTGGERVKEGFGLIDAWRIIEKSPVEDRMVAVEVALSRWLYNAVQAFEVLTIHPDYFRLRKPLARRLYEIARKHCGHQSQWTIGLELLREKTGSKSTLKEFRRSVRIIQESDSLPEYYFSLRDDDLVIFQSRDPKQLAHAATRHIKRIKNKR